MPGTFLRDSVRYLPAVVVPAAVGAIGIPILTRRLDLDQYGDFGLVLSLVGILSAITLWLPSSIIRFYPEYEAQNRLDRFYPTVGRLWLASTAATSGLWFLTLAVVGGGIRSRLVPALIAGGLLLLASDAFGLLASLLRARRQVGWNSFGEVWRAVFGLAVGVALISWLDWGAGAAVGGMVVATFAVLPILSGRLPLRSLFGGRVFDRELARQLGRYAFPLVIGAASAWLLRLSDRVIINGLRGADENGIYIASYKIADSSVGLVVQLFQLPFVVLANRIWEREGETAAAGFVSRVARYYLVVAIPAAVGISLLAQPIVRLATDRKYWEGFQVVPPVAAAAVLLGLQYWFLSAFMFKKIMSRYTIAVGLGAAANIGMNLALVDRYGYVAAGWSTLVGYAVALAAMVTLAGRHFRWPFPWSTLARVLVASAAMAAAVYAIGRRKSGSDWQAVLIGIPVGIAVYGGVLAGVGELRRHEWDSLRRLLVRAGLPGGG